MLLEFKFPEQWQSVKSRARKILTQKNKGNSSISQSHPLPACLTLKKQHAASSASYWQGHAGLDSQNEGHWWSLWWRMRAELIRGSDESQDDWDGDQAQLNSTATARAGQRCRKQNTLALKMAFRKIFCRGRISAPVSRRESLLLFTRSSFRSTVCLWTSSAPALPNSANAVLISEAQPEELSSNPHFSPQCQSSTWIKAWPAKQDFLSTLFVQQTGLRA